MASEEKKEEVAQQQTTKPQAKKKDAVTKLKTLIYAGPNLAGGVLAKYTVFRGELPQHVVALKEKYSDLDKLFVEPATLNSFEQKVAQVGTLQHRAYQNALKGGNQ
ncbi:hypothetical protein [Paenibacillus camelliae]|uniref:hypothetical protein n=1 Tax=Paenibacillus camelliae TaxID=512410 RepID=UPI002041CACC|nr:hypothetical protein [Paenibacillus camelliae]MCM3632935.1 hypothetical protein [Paenibacillus camelliae]